MNKTRNKQAFTLMELLVVIAIIAALVAIMSVSLGQVKRIATNLKQKGEFHGMEISIELFQNEFNFYPDSARVNGGTDYTCGAQRLAEAMQGRDELGFHPKSKWHPDLESAAGLTLYDVTVEDTRKQRKPVYFELKHTGMFTLDQLWGSGNTGNLHGGGLPSVPGGSGSSVLTDVFVRNRMTTVAGDTIKVGSPVLYYKAHPTKGFRTQNVGGRPVVVTNPSVEQYRQWVYNFDDNIDILNLAWLREPSEDLDNAFPPHYQERNDYSGVTNVPELFYQILTQRQDVASGFYKPYNADTFILISAGWDGIYGTKDDVTNFNY